ncbi:ankyrin, partial [Cenococcum geophilum 1.58]|uniref:ankyrin n=1 Tax=Cenococcum geophilum 1.58 TaxID=794803 RepID=UPI00358F3F11
MRFFDRKDKHGRTPFFAAVSRGHTEVARILFASGKADVESKDTYGRTPLAIAALSGKVESVAFLLDHGSLHVNDKDNKGRTPLSLAVGSHVDVVAAIHLAGGDPNSSDTGGRTPLSWAAEKGDFDTSKYLI